MRPELIVASKEFRDYLSSHRFLLLFGMLALLSVIGAVSGISEYNSALAEYNSNLQQASSTSEGFRLRVEMPSILSIFSSYGTYIATFGMLLAVSMGFDMISREKEEGTLKILLTHPVFRDQVINGKIIGAVAMMAVVMLSTFAAIVAIMLFFGIVPAGDDLIRIGAFLLATLLFLLAYLAIAVMCSTVAKNSSMAMLIAVAIVLVGMLVPNLSGTIADAALGEEPEMLLPTATSGQGAAGGLATVIRSQFTANESGIQGGRQGTPMQINPEYTDYWDKRNQITGIINVISPSSDFSSISRAITGRLASPESGGGLMARFFVRLSDEPVSIWESLSSVWINFLALIVIIAVGFGISYARFVRVDVR